MAAHLTSALVGELRRRIITGQIAPGEQLPSETVLIAEHDVSRTVVREALGQLRAEGLIRTRRGSGSFALTPPASTGRTGFPPPARSPAERLALLELRTGFESEAAALAAIRRTDAQLAAMRAALEAFARADSDPSAAVDLDFAFHRTIVEASANPYLLGLLDALGPSMITMPRYRLEPGDEAARRSRLHDVTAEHAAVVEAITARDPLAASASMRTHLASSRFRIGEGSRFRTGA